MFTKTEEVESFLPLDETSSESEDNPPARQEKRKYVSKIPEEIMTTNEPLDVINYLVGQGLEVVDKRTKGGALWVVGGGW